MKNTAAQTAVERDRKLALPVAPNRLPDAPLPNDAPMSAPLPCCSSTSPIMASAVTICRPRTRFITMFMQCDFLLVVVSAGGAADGDEVRGLERCAADQAAVEVGLGEELRCVVGLDAAAVEDAHRGGFRAALGE